MSWLINAVVASLLLHVVCAGEDPTETLPGVEDLTPETFDKLVNGGKHALVEFYAPWCGHCKRMTPELKKLGEAVLADPKLKNRVVVAKVDADKHRPLGERFGVSGFPTIKFFARGKPVSSPVSYDGARTADKFLEYLNTKLQEDKGFARVEAFDELATKYTDAGDKQAVIAEAEAALKDLSGDEATNAALYVLFMKRGVEKGAEYLSTEKARLDRVLSSGSVAANKADEMSRKLSVLGAFVKDE